MQTAICTLEIVCTVSSAPLSRQANDWASLSRPQVVASTDSNADGIHTDRTNWHTALGSERPNQWDFACGEVSSGDWPAKTDKAATGERSVRLAHKKTPLLPKQQRGFKNLAIPTFALVGTIIGSQSLTAVFGMGTGRTFEIWSPERLD